MLSFDKSATLFFPLSDEAGSSAESRFEGSIDPFEIEATHEGQETKATDHTATSAASPETDDLIERYFGEIRQYDLLSLESERALWRRIEHHKARARRALLLSPVALTTLTRLWNQVKHGEISLSTVICSETEGDVEEAGWLDHLSDAIARLHDLAADLNATRSRDKATAVTAAERRFRRRDRARLLRQWIQGWETISLQQSVYDTLQLDLERAVTDQSGKTKLRAVCRVWIAAKRALDGSTEQMLRANLRLVIHVARRFRDCSVPLLDLIQEGNLGLMRAIEKFDPNRDVKFVTYAHWWIRQAVGRAVINQGRTVRLPEHVVQRYQKICATRDKLRQRSGEAPTDQEVGAALGWKPKDVEQLEMATQGAVSLEQSLLNGDRTVADLVANPTANDLSATTEGEGLKHCLETCFENLTPREAFILRCRFGFETGKPQSLRRVGEELGLSRERVRQIEKATLQRIRESPIMTQLADFVGN